MDLKPSIEDSLEEHRRGERRSSRGLEDVSHLFLSPSPGRPAEKAEAPAIASSARERTPAPFLLRPTQTITRELVLELLQGSAAVLEEGLRVIDAAIPCDAFGVIDLVALDSGDQLCILTIEDAPKDDALLRGIAHADWLARNTPIVRRMYQGRLINFSAQPRLFLVAPGFSPLLQCVARRSTNPEIRCFAYRTIAMPGGAGILFERV